MNAAATPFMELRNDITSSFKITLDIDMDNVNLKTLLINIYDTSSINVRRSTLKFSCY